MTPPTALSSQRPETVGGAAPAATGRGPGRDADLDWDRGLLMKCCLVEEAYLYARAESRLFAPMRREAWRSLCGFVLRQKCRRPVE